MLSNAFFLGKGGVGKTTVSAAFALALARSGKRVLIASLDPAHNLGDVYGVTLKDKPITVEPGLDALEVDLAAWVDIYLDESRSEMKATYAYAGTLNLESFFDIMKYSPGTEEYAVLWAIEHIHCTLSPDYDVVVFDTPPTALSLRFLAMPTISNLWIGELTKLRERILSKRESISRVNPGSAVSASCVDKDDDRIYGKLGSIRQRLAILSSLFSKESYVAVVLNPDKLSVSEALRIKSELKKFDIPLSGLCVNKRGVSAAAWSIDERLRSSSTFDINFLPQGLHERDDLLNIETQGLVAHFLANDRKG
ncbi:MAG: ArsA family ATPase [Spirochaetia bacterium]|jgi:arsenite-transporting ATPase|nr:ArsA family ATPase [Spirochaetia bacterium]